jgi:hypothetical protein
MPDPLFSAIDRHFLAPEALDRVRLFPRAGRAVEGWFRGELVHLLDKLAKDGEIEGWRADVPITEGGRQRCDFRIALAGGALWLEAKALSPSAGGPFGDIGSFFPRTGGFTDDLVKLLRVHEGDRAVVLFVYPRPDPAQWADIMDAYARRIAPIGFKEESAIAEYPPELYICKLRLTGGF